jgi:hypothetical protein
MNNMWDWIPKVDFNKFDRNDPTKWVTQREHYFSVHDIIYDLMKLYVDVLYLDHECWQWWRWRKKYHRRYITLKKFVLDLYAHFESNSLFGTINQA